MRNQGARKGEDEWFAAFTVMLGNSCIDVQPCYLSTMLSIYKSMTRTRLPSEGQYQMASGQCSCRLNESGCSDASTSSSCFQHSAGFY